MPFLSSKPSAVWVTVVLPMRVVVFSVFMGDTSFLAMLHKPAFDFFADMTDVVKKIDFLLSNEYLDNEN